MVGITTVSPQAVDESAPCLHVRSASATSQRGCRRCSAQGFFEAARTIYQLAGTRRSSLLFGLQQGTLRWGQKRTYSYNVCPRGARVFRARRLCEVLKTFHIRSTVYFISLIPTIRPTLNPRP